jgi:hypothetical protein
MAVHAPYPQFAIPVGTVSVGWKADFPEAKEAAKSRRSPPFARAVSDSARVSLPLLPNRATTPAPPCAGTGDASPVLGSTGHRTAGTNGSRGPVARLVTLELEDRHR